MSKPIFIVKLPITFSDEKCREALDAFKDKLPEYHVLMVMNSINDWDFKLFSDKEIEPIELEKLKEIINQ